MRVRASAGAGSFRRKEKLEHYLEEATQQVEALKRQIEDDPDALTRRSKAARERAVQARQARIQTALDRLPALDEIKRAYPVCAQGHYREYVSHTHQCGAIMAIDVLERDDLPFPRSLPESQRLFLDEARGLP